MGVILRPHGTDKTSAALKLPGSLGKDDVAFRMGIAKKIQSSNQLATKEIAES